jgi:hypothetical protein
VFVGVKVTVPTFVFSWTLKDAGTMMLPFVESIIKELYFSSDGVKE